jgi:uncharacterized protein YbjT (DUF2867 family)
MNPCDAREILITGGTGSLGSRVAERLSGGKVRVMSRYRRVNSVRGDLLTGEGLEEAVEGVSTIIHCASSPTRTRRVDVEGTEHLLEVAGRAGVGHALFVSIVGIDRNPYFPYYRMKLEAESIVERSPVPWTILRATQFHGFVLRLIRVLDRVPVMIAPKGFLLQPVDVGEVADRTAELALAGPAGRVPDVGGSEIRTFADLAGAYFEVTGRMRSVVELPVPGRTARAFREGAQLCPEEKYGEVRWDEFLLRTLHPEKGGRDGERRRVNERQR